MIRLKEIRDASAITEKALLVHVHSSRDSMEKRVQSVMELRDLVLAAGATVAAEVTQVIDQPHSATYVGLGKVQEIKDDALTFSVDLIVFSVDLSGSQARNLALESKLPVVDRTQVILDIFARRALSFEGKSQVKLAQLLYLLPRLSGQGIHLSRLGGGIGTRGPGETKLEMDRRRIRTEIANLRKVVDEEVNRRRITRRRRSRQGVYAVSIVGYTNAGKTTLLSSLTKRYGDSSMNAGQNRIFDTLDPTARRVKWGGRNFVVTDTVGFIRNLPHHLVTAFRSSLEAVEDADVIIHVVDAASSFMQEEMATVYNVLEQSLHISAPVVTFFNKVDQVNDFMIPGDINAAAWLAGSAMDEEALIRLMEKIDELVGRKVILHLRIPFDRSDLIAELNQKGKMNNIQEDGQVFKVEAEVDEREAWLFTPYAGG